jgi:predicted DNA-binding transcriptional regulator YafY
MLVLQVQHRITARELAQRLEVSERTIYRDMEALSMAGIPVFAERGTGGGWRLSEDYQTKLTGLNEAEIQAVFLTTPARLLSDLGLHQAAETALIKLLAALPSLSRRDAEYARQRFYVDTGGWFPSEEPVACLPTLQEAVWQDRKLQLSYRRSDDTVVERLVDPLGLVAKGRIWYLVAAVEGEVRTYRASRVREALLLDQPCVRPAAFDLAAYWQRSYIDFRTRLPHIPVTLRVSPAILPRVREVSRFSHIEHEDPPDADGWVTLCMVFQLERDAREYILSFGAEIEIIEPADLRAQILCQIEAMGALYRKSSPR